MWFAFSYVPKRMGYYSLLKFNSTCKVSINELLLVIVISTYRLNILIFITIYCIDFKIRCDFRLIGNSVKGRNCPRNCKC